MREKLFLSLYSDGVWCWFEKNNFDGIVRMEPATKCADRLEVMVIDCAIWQIVTWGVVVVIVGQIGWWRYSK